MKKVDKFTVYLMLLMEFLISISKVYSTILACFVISFCAIVNFLINYVYN
ncbi:MAG: hypothetical protein PHF86_12980 [Candidatus Nanoarchaeia archaeon]|nr:hypothetical protein [Candidatus Nanoarchaeia archaeon]